MLIGYWKSHPWTPLATARRYSTVELLGWTAELAPFIPPTWCVCQSRTPVKSTVVTVNYLGAGIAALGNYGALYLFLQTTFSPIWCHPVLQSLTVLKSIETSGDSKIPWLHWEWLCLTTLQAKAENGDAMCSFMVPGGDELFRGRSPVHPKDTIISFSIRHSGVSAWLRGRRPLFPDKWTSPFPPLTFSILDGMWFGWLEVRAISVAGNSLMQTANYCIFAIHSPCPHSNKIAGRLTSSSGVECGEWREMDERQGKWQPLCLRAGVYGSL